MGLPCHYIRYGKLFNTVLLMSIDLNWREIIIFLGNELNVSYEIYIFYLSQIFIV